MDYGKQNIMQLKEELVRRRAKTTGKKEVLIKRLLDYDRNDNFENTFSVVLPPAIIPDWPTSESFESLTEATEIPPISENFLKAYFLYRGAIDKMQNDDLKSLEKGRLLLQSGRIMACSMLSKDLQFYITGVVSASMKKKTTYCFKIKLNHMGEILNTDCECAAGKGPHCTCKHVASVCYLLIHAKTTGALLLEKSCTSRLQNFHHPKKYHAGPPVTAEEMAQETGMNESIFNDPRPEKYRNMEWYEDHVRRCVIGYCASTSKSITLRYLYEGADLTEAQIDHNYLARPFVEYWVDNQLKITKQEAVDIERSTKAQSNCKRWHEERKFRLTSSRIGEILSTTDRRDMVKFCESMYSTQPIIAPSLSHGLKYEAVALEKFGQKYHLKLERSGLVVSDDVPYIAASPDAIVKGLDAVVEVKCPYSGKDDMISPGSKFPFLRFREDGEMELKTTHKYYTQVQVQLGICKKLKGYFIVYTHCDLFVQHILFDEMYFNTVLMKLKKFYNEIWRPFIATKISQNNI